MPPALEVTHPAPRAAEPAGPPDRATAAGPMFRAPGWSWSQTGPVGWWVRPEWSRTLLGPDGLRLAQWSAEGRLTTIKTGP